MVLLPCVSNRGLISSATERSQIEPQVRHDQTWTNASLGCVSLHCFLVTRVQQQSPAPLSFVKGGSQMTGRGHARFPKESLKCFWKACSNDRGVKNPRSASSNKRVKVQKSFQRRALRGVKRGEKKEKAKHYRLWIQSVQQFLRFCPEKMFQMNPLNMWVLTEVFNRIFRAGYRACSIYNMSTQIQNSHIIPIR